MNVGRRLWLSIRKGVFCPKKRCVSVLESLPLEFEGYLKTAEELGLYFNNWPRMSQMEERRQI